MMESKLAKPEVRIHLRARARDRDVIDQAAKLAGTTRSQFMLRCAVKEATNLILDQTRIVLSTANFDAMLDQLEAGPSDEQRAGIERLMSRKPDWA